MPKETFFNLPKEKRENIINIALEEFGTNSYKEASVSKIVRKAGISKGSMYQYFVDKKDLFIYLIKLSVDLKFNYLYEKVDTSLIDFFELLEQMLFYGSKFDIENTQYMRVRRNIFTDVYYDKDLLELPSKLIKLSEDFIKNFIMKSQANKTIRNDIDIDFLAFFVNRIAIESLEGYATLKFGNDVFEKLSAKSISIADNDLKEIITNILEFLKYGLNKNISK